MSAQRKQDAVVRLRSRDPELLSCELSVTVAELRDWRNPFPAGDGASFKSRPTDARDVEIGRLQKKVDDLTMLNEPLKAKIEHL